MKKAGKIVLPGLFALLAAVSLAASSLEGNSAPDFVLKSASGENLRLSEYRGEGKTFFISALG